MSSFKKVNHSVGCLTFPDFKINHNTTIIRAGWCGHKGRLISNAQSQVFFTRGQDYVMREDRFSTNTMNKTK